MFCCACEGSCNHVGAHSYCPAHGGSIYTPTVATPNTVVISHTASGCPRNNQSCGYARGQGYCALWDVCCDLAEISRQLETFKAAGRTQIQQIEAPE